MSDPPRPRPRFVEPLIVGLLLALYWLQATSAVRETSATFDEVAHLVRGHAAWATGDFRLSPPHPPLPQLWATAPLWSPPAELPSFDDPSFRGSVTFTYGRLFLYFTGNDHEALLQRARSAVAVLGALLGLVIFLWSRSLFGSAGGFISLGLYSFTPAFLAHGALVTTDLALTLTLGATMASAAWAYRCCTPLSLALAVLSFAAAVLTKLVALIAIPLLLAWIALLALAREPLALRWGSRERAVAGRARASTLRLGLLGAQLLCALVALWVLAGFRYETFRLEPSGQDRMRSQSLEEAARDSWEGGYRDLPALERSIETLRRSRLLPEFYLYSFVHGAQDSRRSVGWLDGEVVRGGTRAYFPKVVAYKTPPELFAAALLAAACTAIAFRNRRRRSGAGEALRAWLPAAPALLLAGGYGLMMLGSHVTLGERHLLPAWAPVLVLCGAATGWLASPKRLVRALVPAVIGLLALSSLLQRPSYLAYFSPLAGGPAAGHRHLVDSSLDWGQDLPALAALLDEVAGEAPVYLAYFGSADPAAHGVDAVEIPRAGVNFGPGLFCISFTHLQQPYLLGRTAWGEDFETEFQELEARAKREKLDAAAATRLERLRFGRLCAWLREREPVARAGWSIGVWVLDAEALEDALLEPWPAGS